ncbi:MAG: hypothetical protein LBT40_18280, partial [Deltaproteobacteria bacterium]|nr:hypothetical protein [Deltaproteobacteria bacterium]
MKAAVLAPYIRPGALKAAVLAPDSRQGPGRPLYWPPTADRVPEVRCPDPRQQAGSRKAAVLAPD